MQNILIDKKLNVYYIDFGAANITKNQSDHVDSCKFRGTVQYCPPEIFTSGTFSRKAADIWALGSILVFID